MKKVLKLLLCVCVLFCLTGCYSSDKKVTGKKDETIALTLKNEFKDLIPNKKPLAVLKKMASNSVITPDVESVELSKDDYISGFTKEITNYNKAYVLRPMINSIPFIAYIFETDEPEQLETELKENADLRWNICTEADHIETAVYNEYVFIVMAPESF